MKYEEPRGDWVTLPKAWSELREGLREAIAKKAGEIHTYDGGRLRRLDGQWEVLESGHLNDADLVRNALRRPS